MWIGEKTNVVQATSETFAVTQDKREKVAS